MLNFNDGFKQVEGFAYWVSPEGEIHNGKKLLRPYKINSGYLCVDLVNEAGKHKFLIHRLVAAAYIPNIDNKPIVNHKDGDKTNSKVENLEWCTNSENILHARKSGLNPYNLPTLGIKKGNSSKYANVIYDKARNKWIGVIRHNNKNYMQKRFNTEIEAALHVNYIIDVLGLTDRIKNIIE